MDTTRTPLEDTAFPPGELLAAVRAIAAPLNGKQMNGKQSATS